VPVAGAAVGEPPGATAVTIAAPSPGRTSRGVVVGGVVTGALAVGAVVTSVLYNSKLHEYDTANDQLAANRADLRSQTNTLGAVNLALVGGALVAAGVTVFLWTRGPSRDATSAHVELGGLVTPTVSGLILTGSL
jgi:choline-glycine betaine transporter